MELTFAEQVKIVLSRKNMTIKQLAEEIEAKTGHKMSRQNLTQRLGRDNFQEQDMRMIAEILECPFQLNILEGIDESEIVRPVKRPYNRKKKKEEPQAKEVTIGDMLDIMELGEAAMQADKEAEEAAEKVTETAAEEKSEEKAEAAEVAANTSETAAEETVEAAEEKAEETEAKEPSKAEEAIPMEKAEPVSVKDPEPVKEAEPKKEETPVRTLAKDRTKIWNRREQILQKARERSKHPEWVGATPQSFSKDFMADANETGDINPYTNKEYETNSVRMHPKRIGYIQVYDRGNHKWTDMTEWAFLGFQDQKKRMLGNEYDEPIYLE